MLKWYMSSALAFVQAYFGQGYRFGRSIELSEVRCSRSEERLVLCPYSPPIDCFHMFDVGVRCSSPAEPNGMSSMLGHLHVYRARSKICKRYSHFIFLHT